MGNNRVETTAAAKYLARIAELEAKGYELWHARSQAWSEYVVENGGQL
jgi:hypothetical protein